MSTSLISQNRPLIAILGSGQLAKMMAQAAAQLGCRIKTLEAKPNPEPLLNWPVQVGDWNDPDTLVAFANGADVVTLENEFIEADALAELEEEGYALHPSAATMARVQDKLLQKETLANAGLPTAQFRAVETSEEIFAAAGDFGWPLILKRRKLGYDGKGNATIHSPDDVHSAWEKLGGGAYALFVEQFCPFKGEIATIITRARPKNGESPQTVAYPIVSTLQQDHICHTVSAPADLTPEQAAIATQIALKAVEAIDGTGSIGVEFFVMPDGRLLINEIAPRVHNSGHYSIEACHCSQFENHIRAILGWPLGSSAMCAPAAAMVNLLGNSDGFAMPSGLDDALAIEGAHLHIYGKSRSMKGRKMGHVTALGETPAAALATALRAAEKLRFGQI